MLPMIFPTFQGKVQILAENRHAYLTKVSFISKRPLKYTVKLLLKLKLEVVQH